MVIEDEIAVAVIDTRELLEGMRIIWMDGDRVFINPAVFRGMDLDLHTVLNPVTCEVLDPNKLLGQPDTIHDEFWARLRAKVVFAAAYPEEVPVHPKCIYEGCNRTFVDYKHLSIHYEEMEAEYTMSAEQSYPTHPSNRSIMERMILWGWTVKRNKSDWVTMTRENISIDVRPAHYHDGNPSHIISDIYRLTTNGDASKFWNSEPAQPGGPKKDPEPIRTGKRHDQSIRFDQPKKKAERQPVAQPVVPPIEPVVVKGQRQYQGASNKVLDFLIAKRGMAMSGAMIADEMNLPQTVVYSALTHLASKDLAVRVKRGFYRVSQTLLRDDVHVGHSLHTQQAKSEAPVAAPAPEPAYPKLPMVTAVEPAPQKSAPSIDQTLEDLLDLIAPDGFKASHLRAITEWQEATRSLLEALRAG